MFRILIPILLVGASIGLFVLFTDPQYQEVKVVRAESSQLAAAIEQSQNLIKIRDGLLSKRMAMRSVDTNKLDRVLPDNVDNIRLIIDIDTIAARYGLRVRDVSVSAPETSREPRAAGAVGDAGDKVGSVNLSFSVAASYEDFMRFLMDLEQSVRIVDVNAISFTVGQGDLLQYSVAIRTYWLR